MPVAEMLRRISSSELTEWAAYLQWEPPKKPQTANEARAVLQGLMERKRNG